MKFRCRRQGFTLLEILIVVATLVVLAGAVIPQFENAIEDAKQSTMLESQHELNLAVQRYRVEHGGILPSIPQKMTSRTDVSGALNSSGKFGPYILSVPINPLNNSKRVTLVANLGSVDLQNLEGWIVDATNWQVAGGLSTN